MSAAACHCRCLEAVPDSCLPVPVGILRRAPKRPAGMLVQTRRTAARRKPSFPVTMRSRSFVVVPVATGPATVRTAARRSGIRWMLAAGLMAAMAATAVRAASDLINIEVEAERAENGKALDMEFHEIERTPELSRARVLAGNGSSASAVSIFVLRGFCAVAESREMKYFHPRPVREEIDGAAVYTAEFADERIAVTPARLPAPDGAGPQRAVAAGIAADGVFSIDDCRLAGFVR